MAGVTARYEFASDNTAGVCPECWAALKLADAGAVSSYGGDPWTERVTQRIRDLFECDCHVFIVFNGTAANALSLAAICQPFHSIICHELAHLQTDECGAPEFFSGGSKLLTVAGANGKIETAAVAAILASQHGVHSHRPRVISLTQTTELGTVYRHDELAGICAFARDREMLVQMDGARFANAVAFLRCHPKEITWQLGIDVLCFGGTKNGAAAGELIVVFKPELAREFDYRMKQAGQLASKMRFLAAPWTALLTNDLWLRNAERANSAARTLARRLQDEAKLSPVFPVEGNAVFLRLADQTVEKLQERGWQFYKFVEPDVYRLMCSWSITDADIDLFINDAVRITPTR